MKEIIEQQFADVLSFWLEQILPVNNMPVVSHLTIANCLEQKSLDWGSIRVCFEAKERRVLSFEARQVGDTFYGRLCRFWMPKSWLARQTNLQELVGWSFQALNGEVTISFHSK